MIIRKAEATDAEGLTELGTAVGAEPVSQDGDSVVVVARDGHGDAEGQRRQDGVR